MSLDSPSPVHASFPDVDVVGDRATRRRAAVVEAAADAASRCGRSTHPAATALRGYGPGCVALALAGRFDRTAVARLRAIAPEIERHAGTELVIDFAHLDGCDPALARAVARLRIRCLAQQAHVELHDPPTAVAAELGRFRL